MSFDLKRFEVTDEHLALLRAAYVRYDDECEFGAPAIDPKRPYGNSDVLNDIYRVLNGEYPPEHWSGLPDDMEERYRTLHEETAVALQIALAVGVFETGTYEASRYGQDWHRAEHDLRSALPAPSRLRGKENKHG